MLKPPLALLALGLSISALAAPPAVSLRTIVDTGGLAQPVEIAHAGDGSTRLFIVEQAGRIRILKNGALLGTPFLDVTDLTDPDGERGLLGLAFHPQYAANRRFYVFYTHSVGGDLQVSEFLASAANPDLADAASERPIITVPHPDAATYHNGGHIAFGPDGYLYIATGDGGSTPGTGQDLASLLGKLLRIDVNGDDFPGDAARNYAIPPNNPFVGVAGADEIWAYGLRNPWKFSFDRMTGDLYLADVGENAREEANFQAAGAAGGQNYGWNVMEGSACFSPPSGCNTSGKVLPILEHTHADGWSAVIGGYVYRGRKSASLRGFYIYGDLDFATLYAALPNGNGSWSTFPLINRGFAGLSAFGEDEAGELYMADVYSGRLFAIDGPDDPVPPRGDHDGDGRADVLWRNSSTGENYLYPMNGTSIGAGEGYLRTVSDLDWKIVGVGDFDGDGKADVLWRNSSSGENYIYLMDGKDIVGEGYIRAVADQNWEVVGVGDFNGDSKDDILWRNTASGENYIYPMDGLAILPSEGYLRAVADHHWQVAGVGKFDAGPTADILWRNSRTGENYIYLMNGTTIAGEGYLRTVAALEWQIAGVGDVTGDGKDDILWRNVATGENYVYPMSGITIVAGEGYLRTVADLNWRIMGMGDYDADGKADVLWRHAASGDNYLYPMDGLAIKPSEGYLRTVADQSWKPRHSSPFAIRRGEMDGFQGPSQTGSAATGFTTMRMDLFTRETTGVAVSDLASTTNAHIHLGTIAQDGGPIVQMTKVSDAVWIAPAGSFMPAAHYLAFLTDGTYVNIHTPALPNGEIRGQLE